MYKYLTQVSPVTYIEEFKNASNNRYNSVHWSSLEKLEATKCSKLRLNK